MPYVPGVGSIAEIAMLGTLAAGGSNAVNVASIFHYRLGVLTAPPTKVALETVFNGATGIVAPFLAAANSRYTQSQNTVRWIDDALDAPASTARAGVGAIATDGQPSIDSVTMLFRTGIRGKSYRGSKHFPGVNEVDTTDDILTGAGLALWQTLQTACAANLTDALGNVWVPSVLSRKLSTLATNPTTVVANDVTQVLLNLNVGSMRRRRVSTVR
jgi:hypothetical protein